MIIILINAPTTVIMEFCCSFTSDCSSFMDTGTEETSVAVLLNLAYFSSSEVLTLRGVFSVLEDKCSPLSSSSFLIISLKSASKLPGVWEGNRSIKMTLIKLQKQTVSSFFYFSSQFEGWNMRLAKYEKKKYKTKR